MRRGRLMLELQRANAVRAWPPFNTAVPQSLRPDEARAWREIVERVPQGLLVAFDAGTVRLAAQALAIHRSRPVRLDHALSGRLLRASWRSVLRPLRCLCMAPDDRRALLAGTRQRA